jgi:hypothetical protein
MTFLAKDERKTIGEVSIDATAIYNLLKELKHEEVITYATINDMLGRDVRKNISLLYTAIKMARSNDGMVFDCIRKVGYKRLNDTQIVEKTTTQPFLRIKSIVKRTSKDMNCVDTDNLSNTEVVKLNAARSLFQTVVAFSAPKAIAKVEGHSAIPLPFGKTLELFMKS